jgi:hypothetical protein
LLKSEIAVLICIHRIDLMPIFRTEVGRESEDIVAQGGLLPDNMVLKVVTSKLDKLHNKVLQRRILHY